MRSALVLLCLFVLGCDGQETQRLEAEVRQADTRLAELQFELSYLSERRTEVKLLSEKFEKACPPSKPEEVAQRVRTVVGSARVDPDIDGSLVVQGFDGLSGASKALARLATDAPYLGLDRLDAGEAEWTARLSVIAEPCAPLPEPHFTELKLPPKTDWLRSKADALRGQLAATQERIHALEQKIGPNDPVIALPGITKVVQNVLSLEHTPKALAGQMPWLEPLLADRQRRHLLVRMASGTFELASDAPLGAPAGWVFRPLSACEERWCVVATPPKDEPKLPPMLEKLRRDHAG